MPNKVYSSKQEPKSSILKTNFNSRLTSLYGYRLTTDSSSERSSFEKDYGIKFVRVDLDHNDYRIQNAAIGSTFTSTKLTEKLDKLFNTYLTETTSSYSDIHDRKKRLDHLEFMCSNDPNASTVCKLVADEATQLDVQDRLIVVESPDALFTSKVYELLANLGITQQRIWKTLFDIERYGESVWLNKVTPTNGVERIIPVSPYDIVERLEFSPQKISVYLEQSELGGNDFSKDRRTKLNSLIDILKDSESLDLSENIADMYDSKLFGFEMAGGFVTPPWTVTHFRFGADTTEFFPYGRPPLLDCLAPFKQLYSTITLQGLARTMSFPVTLYKVKTTEGMSPYQAFDLVNTVKEEYDNIGVSPASQGSEVYTVNTKIWAPDGLLDIQVIENKSSHNFTEDIKIYEDRMALAALVPKGYFSKDDGSSSMSGVSLMQQYKPFARHVSSIQTVFLESLGELIRLHFAITGEFDYDTPFILSMRFPSEEATQEKISSQESTLGLSQKVIELLTQVLGLSDEDTLPLDVVNDILSKFSFINPTDIKKWTKSISNDKIKKINDEDDGDSKRASFDSGSIGSGSNSSSFEDDFDFDVGSDSEIEDQTEESEPLGDVGGFEESYEKKLKNKQKKMSLNEITKRYKPIKDSFYVNFMESNQINDFKNVNTKRHYVLIPKIRENNPMYRTFSLLSNNKNSNEKQRKNRLEEVLNKKL